jgi:peptide/nickel transport system substrate-binding protein
MRVDKPELPFADKRVRQALMLAIDHPTLKDVLYGGEAELVTWPSAQFPGYDDAHVALEDLPANVQELYGYNPEKAKQLLADAGYADGFTTHIVCRADTFQVDPLSAVKDMWAKVGVELILDTKDYSVYNSIRVRKTYDEMIMPSCMGPSAYAQLLKFRGTSVYNLSNVNEQRYEDAFMEIMQYNLVDQAKVDEIFRGLMPDVLENAWVLSMPTPPMYVFWTPWVKNYRGEFYPHYNMLTWPTYAWIDQELKQEMK